VSEAPTVLVVDDDAAMRAGLADNLELEGYQVVSAATLREGREAALNHRPDLIILDLMLPDGDGVSLCRQLRLQGYRQPIIMLTARAEEMDKLLGFEVGADDYVVKPFGLRELLARVRAHLRRRPTMALTGRAVQVGAALADFQRHLLTRDGAVLDTSAKEMDLLKYLAMHRGQVVSREEILAEVWGHQREIATRTVDNFVVRLRKKIEPDPAEPRFLITIHGAGYKLVEQ
jgi:DNA-binding response OmpR family regulator